MSENRQEMQRFQFLRVLILGLGLVLAARLVHVQIIMHDEYGARADAQWGRAIPIHAERGNLYDRNGNPLALSVFTYRIGVSKKLVKDLDRVSGILGEVLEQDAKQIRRKVARAKGPHVVLARKVVLTGPQKIRLEAERAVTMDMEHSRVYPLDGVGAALIGFHRRGPQEAIATGLELSLGKYLAGTEGQAREICSPNPYEDLGRVVLQEAAHGNSLELSLDADLQTIAENELRHAVADNGARGGSLLILDPWTGDVLAAASWPLVDSRRGPQPDDAVWVNNIFTQQFEPGSVFKIFSAASLLRNSAIDTATVYNCDNNSAPDLYVRNDMEHDYGNLNLTDAFAQSSNVYFAKAIQNLDPRELYRDITDFGFGQQTSFPYAGQSAGTVHPPSEWSGRSMQTLAIGQELAVTPLQLGMAVASVANGGTLYAPRLIRAMIDDRGRVIEEVQPVPLRRVMAPPLSAYLRDAMASVVSEGTGKQGQLSWITVGGKTGTAQMSVDGRGYTKGAYMASFAGMVPSQKPRLVIVAVLDRPKASRHYASMSAVPLFSAVVTAVRRTTDWLTDAPGPLVGPIVTPGKQDLVTVPDVLHVGVSKASRILANADLQPVGGEKEGLVIQQVPAPGTRCLPGTTVELVAANTAAAAAAAGSLCPDFTGLSNRQVQSLAARLGIPVVIKGVGYAVQQDLKPAQNTAGKPITVRMATAWR
jgi:cell division protein FtsI/penicillin-binding protein 2